MLQPAVCLLVLGVASMASGLIIGDEGPPGVILKKSPVYFPVLPEDFKDIGIKAGRSGGFLAERKKKVEVPVPTTTKPTTTTDRLPLNPHGVLSHVALEPVTKPPGPSYLTDSYYYLDDHTPIPGSIEVDDDQSHDRESEKQELQSLTPLTSRAFGKQPPTALALVDPTPTPAAHTPTHPPSTLLGSTPITSSTPRRTTPAPPAPLGYRPPATTPAPPPALLTALPHKSIKLRPAYVPIPTPTPPARLPTPTPPARLPTPTPPARSRDNYTPSRAFIQPPAREASHVPARSTARPATVRLISRRPKFESSRLGALANIPFQTTTAEPSDAHRTPTPPTTPSRGFGRRTPVGLAPGRQSGAGRGRPEEAPVYRTSTKAYRAPSSLYHVRGATVTTVTVPSQPDFVQSDPNIYVPVEYDEEAIPGEAGVDYPVYETVPDTPFACRDQEHPGLYADVDAQCQTFHICQEDGRHDSFLCPNGTVFNQQYFVCDWWYNFSCDHATRFYSLNALIYELPDASKYARK